MDYTITKMANQLYRPNWITYYPIEELIDKGTYNLTYGSDHYNTEMVITQVLDDYVIYRINFYDNMNGLSQIIIKKESVILYEDPSTTPEWLIWTIFQNSTFFGVVADN